MKILQRDSFGPNVYVQVVLKQWADVVVTRTLSSLTALEIVTIPFTELFSLCITKCVLFYAKTDVSVEYIWSLQFRLHQIFCIVAYWPYKKPKYKNSNVE